MAVENSDITPPRPPEGQAPAQAPGRQAEARRDQLKPEAAQADRTPAAPGVLPAEPDPAPPQNPPAGNPAPKSLPPDAEKEFPERHYGNSAPQEPPPETRD